MDAEAAVSRQLEIAEWAKGVFLWPADATVPMKGSPAMGRRLVTNGHLGVDLIRLHAGESFSPHTHPGDHVLIVIDGRGTIVCDQRVYPTDAGSVYLVPGAVPHAVGAITECAILAVGSPHKAVDAPDRMELVSYAAVATEIGELHCLVCGTLCNPGDCPHVPIEWASR